MKQNYSDPVHEKVSPALSSFDYSAMYNKYVSYCLVGLVFTSGLLNFAVEGFAGDLIKLVFTANLLLLFVSALLGLFCSLRSYYHQEQAPNERAGIVIFHSLIISLYVMVAFIIVTPLPQ